MRFPVTRIFNLLESEVVEGVELVSAEVEVAMVVSAEVVSAEVEIGRAHV